MHTSGYKNKYHTVSKDLKSDDFNKLTIVIICIVMKPESLRIKVVREYLQCTERKFS